MTPQSSPLYLIKLIVRYGQIPFYKWPTVILLLIKCLLSIPLRTFENIFNKDKIKTTSITKDPIFILGHYRSGTTLLHKLMASDPKLETIRNFDLLFPYYHPFVRRMIEKPLQILFQIAKFKLWGFNNLPYSLQDPNEDDIYIIHNFSRASAYWGLLFPNDAESLISRVITMNDDSLRSDWQIEYLYFLKRITRKSKNKRLVLKSPPNTGRIPALLELFPNAKFIFIHRNPYEVYYSMKLLWEKTISKKYALQKCSEAQMKDFIFSHYLYLHDRYELFKSSIPEGNLIEIRYEQLRKTPIHEMRKIYDSLQLGAFEEVENAIKTQIEKEKSYCNFSYIFEEQTCSNIEGRWSHYINLWGYGRPDCIKS